MTDLPDLTLPTFSVPTKAQSKTVFNENIDDVLNFFLTSFPQLTPVMQFVADARDSAALALESGGLDAAARASLAGGVVYVSDDVDNPLAAYTVLPVTVLPFSSAENFNDETDDNHLKLANRGDTASFVAREIASKTVAKLQSNYKDGGTYRSGGVIMANGSLRIWGINSYDQLGLGSLNPVDRKVPELVTNIISASKPVKWLAAGYCHWVLLEDGSIYSWGRNNEGECGVGNTAQVSMPELVGGAIDGVNIVDIAVGNSSYVNSHTVLALADTGQIFAVGSNSDGQIGDGTTVDKTTFVEVGMGQTWAKIFVFGSSVSCWCAAITTSGDLYTWGENAYGQLGVGDTTNRNSPTFVNAFGGVDVDSVSGGGGDGLPSGNQIHGTTLILLTDGKVYSCGSNVFGQLGLGNTTDYNSPQEVTGLGTDNSEVIVVGGYECTTYVRKTGDSVYAAGYNGSGELGVGTTTNANTFAEVIGSDYDTIEQVMAIGGKGYNSLYIRYSDGTIKCCGYGGYGRLGNGANGSLTALTNISLNPTQFKPVDMCAYGQPSEEAGLGILTEKGQLLILGSADDGQSASIDVTSSAVPRLIRF